jgi:hypothetical protein
LHEVPWNDHSKLVSLKNAILRTSVCLLDNAVEQASHISEQQLDIVCFASRASGIKLSYIIVLLTSKCSKHLEGMLVLENLLDHVTNGCMKIRDRDTLHILSAMSSTGRI